MSTSKEMEELEKQLSQLSLSEKAMEIVQEIETWLSKLEPQEMTKITEYLYGCQRLPVILDMVKRLVAELPFIETKVYDEWSSIRLGAHNYRMLSLNGTFFDCLAAPNPGCPAYLLTGHI